MVFLRKLILVSTILLILFQIKDHHIPVHRSGVNGDYRNRIFYTFALGVILFCTGALATLD